MRFKSTLPSSQRELGSNAQDSTSLGQSDLMSLKSAADLNYNTVRSTDSFTSSQQNQLEFIQDNIDYQWFIDYGYRDGSSSLQRSSILSASCYDDLARDLDANLAHVDMEDFSHEDIHSLLHTLPPMCVRDIQNRQGEMFASVSSSLPFPSSSTPPSSPPASPHSSSSLVKSGPLFSPVKEVCLPPAGTYSVDSLDCDEMMITCQHPNNKHAYTIAFQGSTIMMSSDTNDSSEDGSKCSQHAPGSNTTVSAEHRPMPRALTELRGSGTEPRGGLRGAEMSNSDAPLTTWSKLTQEPELGGALSRAPSGNNNSTPIGAQFDNVPLGFKPLQSASSVPSLLQTQSLPNLVSNKHQQWLLRNKLLALNSSINAAEKAFDVPIKLFDIQQSMSESLLSPSPSLSRHSVPPPSPPLLTPTPTPPLQKHTTTPSHQPNFSLLKLFIKQKNQLDLVAPTSTGDDNLNYMSWNDELGSGGCTEESHNVNSQANVAGWAARLKCGNTASTGATGGKNLNHTKFMPRTQYLNENNNNNNNEFSYDSLTNRSNTHQSTNNQSNTHWSTNNQSNTNQSTGNTARVDNQDHLSISQSSRDYCDCEQRSGLCPSSRECEDLSQELAESSDSFSSHTNRATVRCAVDARFAHHDQCPMFDKSMQTSHQLAASASKTQSRSSGGDRGGRQVYVLYPNYTLPDLSFLQDHATELDLNNVFLWPQKFEPSPVSEQAPPLLPREASAATNVAANAARGRPMSCVDIEALKRKGFSHVRDWSSLVYLLPREYTRILADIPELSPHLKPLDAHLSQEAPGPLFCNKKRVSSCGESTSSSNAPSSGYRGSSSILNEETGSTNPLFIYRYDSISSESSMLQQPPALPKRQHSLASGPDEVAPPRPPLPRSILRHPPLDENIAKLRNKRFSMFEFGSRENLDTDEPSCQQNTTHQQQVNKRSSLPSNFINKKEGVPDHVWEDEGVDIQGGTDTTVSSEILGDSSDSWQREDISTLRAQVIKFLNSNHKDSQQRRVVSFVQQTPPNSPNAKPLYQCKLQSGGISGAPIKEERESASPESKVKPSQESVHRDLIDAILSGTRHLVDNFSAEQPEQTSHLALHSLCPPLYALLSQGLNPCLSTSFGETPNSVWQVIEASAQMGPSTRSLAELVLHLNSEATLLGGEGLLKCNAFLLGLLNLRGLDTWLSLLLARESLLARHYSPASILLAASRGQGDAKCATDLLVDALRPLAALPFKLDLLYQCRRLYDSLCALNKSSMTLNQMSPAHSARASWTLKKLMRSLSPSGGEEGISARPRSCVGVDMEGMGAGDVAGSATKRWSTLALGSKLALAFQSLVGEDDEYPDSLEPELPQSTATHSTTTGTLENKRLTATAAAANDTSSDLSDMPELSSYSSGGGKFKRLQQRWEMLSGTPLSTPASSPVKSRSRIPRPVSSPTPPPNPLPPSRPSSLPHPVARKPPLPSPTSSAPPPLIRKPPVSSPTSSSARKPPGGKTSFDLGGGKPAGKKPTELVTLPSKMALPATQRASRMDGMNPRPPVTRPSSLPYRKPAAGVESRRAASSSTTGGQSQASAPKYVKTLCHRLPSDNGHLSYNSGERLKVVLEVDETWLLCCRGRQKGLVPRSAVILY